MPGLSRAKTSLMLFFGIKSPKLIKACHEVDIQDTDPLSSNVTASPSSNILCAPSQCKFFFKSYSRLKSVCSPCSVSPNQNRAIFSNHFQREDKAQRERDLKRLALAFIFSDNQDLRSAVILTTRITNIKFKVMQFSILE